MANNKIIIKGAKELERLYKENMEYNLVNNIFVEIIKEINALI